MRALLPDVAADVDVHAHYAAGWLDRGGIRANMVAGADGAAAADGLSAGLQTPGDNLVFATLRDLADVVLVGAGTAAAEGYGPASVDATRRTGLGLPADLPIAVVSRSLNLDLGARLFTASGPRPFVVTCASSDRSRRDRVAERAEVLVCGADDIDYAVVRAELARHGRTRVLCEGGPTILGRVLAGGALDELCLSLTPAALGPGAGRIVAGPGWTDGPRALRLSGLLEEDGALFLRYAVGSR